jgi:hypothetical protein
VEEMALAKAIQESGSLNVPADKRVLFEQMLTKTQEVRSLSWERPNVPLGATDDPAKMYNRYMNMMGQAVSKYKAANAAAEGISDAEGGGMFVWVENIMDVDAAMDAVEESGVFDLIGPAGLMQTGAELMEQGSELYSKIKRGDSSNCELALGGMKVLVTTASCIGQTASLLADGGSVVGSASKAGAKALNKGVDSMSFLCNPQDEAMSSIAAAVQEKFAGTLEAGLQATLEDAGFEDQAEYLAKVGSNMVVEEIKMGSAINMALQAGVDASKGDPEAVAEWKRGLEKMKNMPAFGEMQVRRGRAHK